MAIYTSGNVDHNKLAKDKISIEQLYVYTFAGGSVATPSSRAVANPCGSSNKNVTFIASIVQQ